MKKRLTKKKFKSRFEHLREKAYKLISDEAIIGYQRVFTELKERNINQAINSVVREKTKGNNIHELWNLRRPVAIKDVSRNIIAQSSKLDNFYRGFLVRREIIWNPFLGILEDISKPYFKKGKFGIKPTHKPEKTKKKRMAMFRACVAEVFKRQCTQKNKVEYAFGKLGKNKYVGIIKTAALKPYEVHLDNQRMLDYCKALQSELHKLPLPPRLASQKNKIVDLFLDYYTEKVNRGIRDAEVYLGERFIRSRYPVLDGDSVGYEEYVGFHRTYICYAELLKKFSNWLNSAELLQKFCGDTKSAVHKFIIFHLKLGADFYREKMNQLNRFLYDLYVCMRTKIDWYSYDCNNISRCAIDDTINFNYWLWQHGINKVEKGEFTIGEFYTWYTKKLLLCTTRQYYHSSLDCPFYMRGKWKRDKLKVIEFFTSDVRHKSFFTEHFGDVRKMSLPNYAKLYGILSRESVNNENISSEWYVWKNCIGDAELSKFGLLREKLRKAIKEYPDKRAEVAEWYYNELIEIYEYSDKEITDLQKIYMETFSKRFNVYVKNTT